MSVEDVYKRQDQANAHLAEKQKDLSDYKAETLKVIRGQSNLSVELLNALVKETETMIALAQTRIDAAQTEYAVSYTHLDVYKRQLFPERADNPRDAGHGSVPRRRAAGNDRSVVLCGRSGKRLFCKRRGVGFGK